MHISNIYEWCIRRFVKLNINERHLKQLFKVQYRYIVSFLINETGNDRKQTDMK